jgi:hypothetical protein
MPSELSLTAIVARLQEQIAFRRDREAFHAEREVHHREQRALHAAELETLTASLEAFQATAATAVELASRNVIPPPAAPKAAVPDADVGRKPSLTRMVTRVVELQPAGESFGAAAVTAEINRHYGERLRRPVKDKLVSIILRRMLAEGTLRSVRKGRPHHEALYAKAKG